MTSDMQNSSPSQTPGNAGDPVKKAQASGLPVRGLAMILIAVAVLLAAWALWSLSSDNDADSAATGTDTIQSQDEGTQNASNDGGLRVVLMLMGHLVKVLPGRTLKQKLHVRKTAHGMLRLQKMRTHQLHSLLHVLPQKAPR